MMKSYGGWDGRSGISRYGDDVSDAIVVEFNNDPDQQYNFSDANSGAVNLREMKRLAKAGSGPRAFINKNRENLHCETIGRLERHI
jgi:hypothetical protein